MPSSAVAIIHIRGRRVPRRQATTIATSPIPVSTNMPKSMKCRASATLLSSGPCRTIRSRSGKVGASLPGGAGHCMTNRAQDTITYPTKTTGIRWRIMAGSDRSGGPACSGIGMISLGQIINVVYFIALVLEKAQAGVVAMFYQRCADRQAERVNLILGGAHQHRTDSPPLVLRPDAQAIDPALAPVVSNDDHAHQFIAIQRTQDNLQPGRHLFGEALLAFAACGLVMDAAGFPDLAEGIVIGGTQRANLDHGAIIVRSWHDHRAGALASLAASARHCAISAFTLSMSRFSW